MEVDEKKDGKSKYSSGLNIIMRLDALWKDTHRHARANRFYDWNNDLDCIWRELARDLKDKNYDKWKKEIDKVNKQIKNCGKFRDTEDEGFDDPSIEILNKREKHYQLLDQKQLILARLENELGKGTTESDDEDDDFD